MFNSSMKMWKVSSVLKYDSYMVDLLCNSSCFCNFELLSGFLKWSEKRVLILKMKFFHFYLWTLRTLMSWDSLPVLTQHWSADRIDQELEFKALLCYITGSQCCRHCWALVSLRARRIVGWRMWCVCVHVCVVSRQLDCRHTHTHTQSAGAWTHTGGCVSTALPGSLNLLEEPVCVSTAGVQRPVALKEQMKLFDSKDQSRTSCLNPALTSEGNRHPLQDFLQF